MKRLAFTIGLILTFVICASAPAGADAGGAPRAGEGLARQWSIELAERVQVRISGEAQMIAIGTHGPDLPADCALYARAQDGEALLPVAAGGDGKLYLYAACDRAGAFAYQLFIQPVAGEMAVCGRFALWVDWTLEALELRLRPEKARYGLYEAPVVNVSTNYEGLDLAEFFDVKYAYGGVGVVPQWTFASAGPGRVRLTSGPVATDALLTVRAELCERSGGEALRQAFCAVPVGNFQLATRVERRAEVLKASSGGELLPEALFFLEPQGTRDFALEVEALTGEAPVWDEASRRLVMPGSACRARVRARALSNPALASQTVEIQAVDAALRLLDAPGAAVAGGEIELCFAAEGADGRPLDVANLALRLRGEGGARLLEVLKDRDGGTLLARVELPEGEEAILDVYAADEESGLITAPVEVLINLFAEGELPALTGLAWPPAGALSDRALVDEEFAMSLRPLGAGARLEDYEFIATVNLNGLSSVALCEIADGALRVSFTPRESGEARVTVSAFTADWLPLLDEDWPVPVCEREVETAFVLGGARYAPGETALMAVGTARDLEAVSAAGQTAAYAYRLASGGEAVALSPRGPVANLRAASEGEAVIEAVQKDGAVSRLTVRAMKSPRGLQIANADGLAADGAPYAHLAVGEKFVPAFAPGAQAEGLSLRLTAGEDCVRLEAGGLLALRPGKAQAELRSALDPDWRLPLRVYVLDLEAGEDLLLGVGAAADFAPRCGFAANWRYESDAPQVAAVDERGRIAALSPGRARLRAYLEDTGIFLQRAVAVAQPSWAQAELTLAVGEARALAPLCRPADLLPVVRVEDERVAVYEAGTVLALSAGETALIASVGEGVEARLPLRAVALFAPAEMHMRAGEAAAWSVQGAPGLALHYASSDPVVARVDEEGRVAALAPGECTLTARLPGARDAVSCRLCVYRLEAADGALIMAVGGEQALNLSVQPAGSALMYQSDRPEIVSVDAGGALRAHKAGEAVVSAEIAATGGAVRARVAVRVVDLRLSPREAHLLPGESVRLQGVEGARFATSDARVATVDDDGLVRAVAPGEAEITARLPGTDLCATAQISVRAAPGAMQINRLSASIWVGEELLLTAAGGDGAQARWESDAPGVAAVDQTGRVLALAAGEATISARGQAGAAACRVLVRERPRAIEILRPAKGAQLVAGQRVQVLARSLPEGSGLPELTYQSGDESAMRVDERGRLQAGPVERPTRAVLAVSLAEDPSVSASVAVEILPASGAAAALSLRAPGAMRVGQTAQLFCAAWDKGGQGVDPAGAGLSWQSANEAVAQVDKNGAVRALAPGRTAIEVSAPGGARDRVSVVVEEAARAQSLTFRQSPAALAVGEVMDLDAAMQILPAACEERPVFSVTGEAVVLEGRAVRAVRPGLATARAELHGLLCEMAIEVATPPAETVEILGQFSELRVGEARKLSARVLPADAGQDVIWQSSDERVARATADGLVAVGEGQAVLTARSLDGPAASARLTVLPALRGVRLLARQTMWVGETQALSAVTVPESAARGRAAPDFSAEGDCVALENGVLTARKPGAALLRCQLEGREAALEITVRDLWLSGANGPMAPGETRRLEARVLPEDQAPRAIFYASSNPAVASVDAGGQVTAHRAGAAEIRVWAGDCTRTVAVEVRQTLRELTLPGALRAGPDARFVTLYPAASPSDAPLDGLAWYVNGHLAPDVAAAQDGVPFAVVPLFEDARVEVYCQLGGVKSNLCVIARGAPGVQSIAFAELPEYGGLAAKGGANLSAISLYDQGARGEARLGYELAGEGRVSFASTDEGVVTVSHDEARRLITLRAVGPGEAGVRAAADGGATAYLRVRVVKAARGLFLPGGALSLRVGEQTRLLAQLLPEDCGETAAIDFRVDGVCAEIDGDALIARAPGRCTLTATATLDDGRVFTARRNVEVLGRAQAVAVQNPPRQLTAGQSLALKGVIYPQGAAEAQWASGDPAVAAVDEGGVLRALAPGRTEIFLEAGGAADSFPLIVTPDRLSFARDSIELTVGETASLALGQALDGEALYRLRVSAPEALRAELRGGFLRVEALAVPEGGTAQIEMTVGAAACSVQARVCPAALSLRLDDRLGGELLLGEARAVALEVAPQGAQVRFASSDPGVLRVDERSGALRAVGVGAAQVVARSGKRSAHLAYRVSPGAQALEILRADGVPLGARQTLYLDEVLRLRARDASGAACAAVSYQSSDPAVAEVDADGVIYPRRPGKAVVTATGPAGEAARACLELTVASRATGLLLNAEAHTLKKGEHFQLVPRLLPAGAQAAGEIRYAANPEGVVLVDERGVVTRAEGAQEGACADVTATLDGLAARCRFVVGGGAQVDGLRLEPDELSLDLSGADEAQLVAILAPEEARGETVIWQSDDAAVARVDEGGNVKALGEGQTLIRATAEANPQATAACLVRVIRTRVVPESVRVKAGGAAQLALEPAPEGAVLWLSEQPNIAAVDRSGVVRGLSPGSARILAALSSGARAYCKVVVAEAVRAFAADYPYDDRLGCYLLPGGWVGDAFALEFETEPQGLRDLLVYESDDEAVARVDARGVVTLVGAGRAVISAFDPELPEIRINFLARAAERDTQLRLDRESLALAPGQAAQLICLADPPAEITWESADARIAAVDQAGRVLAVAPGETRVTARAKDGRSASCRVQVADRRLTISAKCANIGRKEKVQLTALLGGEAQEGARFVWKSSNKKVVKVDAGGKVTGVNYGRAAVTATDRASGEQARIELRVLRPVSGVKLSKKELALYPGKKGALKARCIPGNATLKKCDWTSSDETVATVDAKGVVTAVAPGKAAITAASRDGRAAAKCQVTVKIPASEISLTMEGSENLTMPGGSKRALKIALAGETGFDDEIVSLTSNKKKRVKLSYKKGKDTASVTAAGDLPGEAVLTVTAKSGLKREFTLTVAAKKRATGMTFALEGSDAFAMPLGGKRTLTIELTGEAGFEDEIASVTSNKKKRVKLSYKKGGNAVVITAAEDLPGEAIITVKTAGGLKQSVTIAVK